MADRRLTTHEKIQAAERELARLKKLDPKDYKRRLGSGNHSLETYIKRQEQYLERLKEQNPDYDFGAESVGELLRF